MSKIFKIQNQKGYTLIELIVGISIFGVLMITVTSLFFNILKVQRSTLNFQDVDENMRFFMEILTKEIRFARGDYNGSICSDKGFGNTGDYKIFNINGSALNGNEIYFQNTDKDCVKYEVVDNVIKKTVSSSTADVIIYSASTTPNNLIVDSLNFVINDNPVGAVSAKQAKVTFSIKIRPDNVDATSGHTNVLQTTVSSRYYR